MAVKNMFVPNTEVVPLVNSSIFSEHPDKRFAIGVLGVGTTPAQGLDAEFTAYLKLRANVYIDQTNMLPKSARLPDSTEHDGDDKRSVHIAVLENRMAHTAVIGSMRLIQKTPESSEALPIEQFFDESFAESPAPIGSLEVSRYIIRHAHPETRFKTRTRLFGTALGHILGNNLGPTYAVVEADLEEGLQEVGVPLKRLAEPKFVEEYNDYNVGVVIDTTKLAHRLGPETVKGGIPVPGEFQFWGSGVDKALPNLHKSA